jgi:hypothetical protein
MHRDAQTADRAEEAKAKQGEIDEQMKTEPLALDSNFARGDALPPNTDAVPQSQQRPWK